MQCRAKVKATARAEQCIPHASSSVHAAGSASVKPCLLLLHRETAAMERQLRQRVLGRQHGRLDLPQQAPCHVGDRQLTGSVTRAWLASGRLTAGWLRRRVWLRGVRAAHQHAGRAHPRQLLLHPEVPVDEQLRARHPLPGARICSHRTREWDMSSTANTLAMAARCLPASVPASLPAGPAWTMFDAPGHKCGGHAGSYALQKV